MKKQEPVTLAAFKDYIDTHVQEGVNQATVAATSFMEALDADELLEAVRYAAEQNIEVLLIPDVNEYEPDPQPDEDERRAFDREATLNKGLTFFSHPLTQHSYE